MHMFEQALSTFQACRMWSYLIVPAAFGALFLCVLGGIFALIKYRRLALFLGLMGVVLGLGTIGLGQFGKMWGRSSVDAALIDSQADAELSPADAELIRTQGYAEAQVCVEMGAFLSAPPILLGMLVIAIAWARRSRTSSVPTATPRIPQ